MTDLPPAAPSAPRWMRVTLIISLALNLVVAGLVVGAIFGDHDHRTRAPRELSMPYSRAVDPEDRRGLLRAMQSELRSERPTRTEVQAEYARALNLLRADPFDADALDAHLSRQASRSQLRIDVGQRVLVEYLTGLDATARAAYADRLEEAMARGPNPRGWQGERN